MEVFAQGENQKEDEKMPSKSASRSETELLQESKIVVNTPIFLLIREQAKSVIAIQELQVRMTVLEGIQERLMLAIQNVQHHMVDNTESKTNSSPSTTLTNSWVLDGSTRKLAGQIPSKQNSLFNIDSQEKLTEATIDITTDKTQSDRISTSSKGDSYDKDSGLDSDYREQKSEFSIVPSELTRCNSQSSQHDDELLQLLDMIDQKSLLLLQQVENVEKKKINNQDMDDVASGSTSLNNLVVENLETQRQLSEVIADRDDLRNRLSKLEFATDAVLAEKIKLQKKLETMLIENQQLQTKIQNFGGNRKKDLEDKNNEMMKENSGTQSMIERGNIKRKYLQYNEKSRKKVSSVLKENNIIELQRQLLMYMMENDVLHAKLEHDHPTRLFHWMKVEANLKQELKNALNDKKELLKQLEKSKLETRSLQETVKYLEESLLDIQREKSVRNFGLGSTDDWRDLTNMKQGNSNMIQAYSPLGYGDFSKTQSLPAMIHLDTNDAAKVQQHNEYLHNFDSERFTDVSLDRSSTSNTLTNSCQSHSFCKDLLDLNDASHNDSCSGMTNTHSWNNRATPSLCCYVHGQDINGQRWSYTSLNMPKLEHEDKLAGQHRWRQDPTNDLESICTEFDPLSENASCENFVDSLNLSIPLKPTRVISQLSSIGDSLHSASLDLGCASSAIWHEPHKLSSARSVDGIQQYFIDNSIHSYYKGRTFPQFGQGNGGNTPSVNVMNCLHESPNYTILQ